MAVFNIMTFNIRFGTAPDGPNHWEKRKDLLISVINKHNPDILCLQEAMDFQVDYIVAHSTIRYARYGSGRDHDLKGESVSILVDPTAIQVHNPGATFWLSDTPQAPGSATYGNTLPRIATWLTFTPINFPTITPIHLVNTHLDHESALARHRGIQQILNTLPPADSTIVTGDFNNDTVESPEVRSAGFIDTLYESTTD
ncbi:hypothetical protein HDU96_001197 [Phlyctochytrium bullatum]|nr:hypothetical protein HDU96_001197 [Phlyctochytrium bullatum]